MDAATVYGLDRRLSKTRAPNSLKVKENGTVMDGNTRLRVLEERGVDINNLPRDIYSSAPLDPLGMPEGEEGPMEPPIEPIP